MSNSKAEQILGDNVKGLIQVENYGGTNIPLDKWDIETPMEDIIMAEYVDTPDGENVERDGVLLPLAMVERSWRVCQVIKAGPKVSPLIKEGCFVIVPSDKGIPAIQRSKEGKKMFLLFINEARVFCIVKPKDINFQPISFYKPKVQVTEIGKLSKKSKKK